MESSTLKEIEENLKNIQPYEKDDDMPDEIHSWEEFDRCMATMLRDLKKWKKQDNGKIIFEE